MTTTRRRVPRAPESVPEDPPDLLVLPTFTYEEPDRRHGQPGPRRIRIALFSADPRDIPAVLMAFTGRPTL